MPEAILSTTDTWDFLHLHVRRTAPGQLPASTAIWRFLPQISGSAFTIRLLFPERACWGRLVPRVIPEKCQSSPFGCLARLGSGTSQLEWHWTRHGI